eukprot:TRINITY_DN86061_c0_g1_i1.p2 TRINITY_DN86061_c0_g1~~TRINITY_DN86061_c0_g1_i1.p2  ORF type:complete len:134 (-),score=54.32 TRINITY_DN86061_c0_g1_i1:37-396(-)
MPIGLGEAAVVCVAAVVLLGGPKKVLPRVEETFKYIRRAVAKEARKQTKTTAKKRVASSTSSSSKTKSEPEKKAFSTMSAFGHGVGRTTAMYSGFKMDSFAAAQQPVWVRQAAEQLRKQ